MDTTKKVQELFKELGIISQNTSEGSFLGLFETEKEYIVKAHGSALDFANILIYAAKKDETLKNSILMAALTISKKDDDQRTEI